MPLRKYILMIVCSLIFTPSAWAEINFAGFLSVGGGQLIDDDEIAEYEGFDGKWKSDPDTVFALQISAPIGERLSATGQMVSKGNNSYEVEAEWAYVSYEVNDAWQVRAGRFRAPFFKYSDFIDVGYAYPYIRPPSQVYRILFSNVTGVDALYNTSIGSWEASFQFYYGRVNASVVAAGETLEFDLPNLGGLNMSFNYDWLTLALSHSFAPETTIPNPAQLQALLNGLTAFGLTDVADVLEFKNETTSFTSVSINIDYNDWLLESEYTLLNHRDQSFLSSDDAWFIMLGKRMGNFTFHLTYDVQETDPDFSFLDGIPDGLDPALDGIKAVIGGAVVDQSENRVITLGVRYELSAGAALKLEYADLELQPLIAGPKQKGGLLSFAVDVVF